LPKTRRIQTSFSKGELSPLLEGKPDLAGYYEGGAVFENVLITRQGGAFRRWGTRMVKEVKDSAKDTIVLPFEFSVDDSYILEVGDLYIRVYKDFAPVLNVGVHVEIVTPFVVADIREIHFTQSADILFLFHGTYQQRKLSRVSDTNWTLSTQVAAPPPSFEDDTDLGDTLAPSANTGSGVTFRAGSAIFLAADDGRQIVAGASRAVITSITNTTEVVADILDAFAQPITAASNTLVSTATAVGSVAHGLAVGDFILLTDGAQAGQMREVTGIVNVDNATIATAFSVNQTTTAWSKIVPLASGAWHLRFSPQTTLNPNKSTPIGAVVTLVAGAAAFRAADVGKYLVIYGGVVRITTFDSTTQVKGVLESAMGDTDLADPGAAPAGSWFLQTNSWTAGTGFPRTGEFYQGRLYVASTAEQPTTFWGSRSDDFDNFAIGVTADDAVENTMASRQVNRIEWLADNRYLFIGTTGTEHRAIGSTNDNSPIGGDTIPLVERLANNGAAPIQPIPINNVLLYVDRSRRKILKMGFDLDADGFATKELTVGAEHITESGVRLGALAFEKRLDQRLWFVREDGTLVTMTFFPEEKVNAFTRLVTDGTFESVAIIADPDGGADQVWVVAKRTINGATKRFVEVFDATYQTDCSTGYQGSAVTSMTGLTYLNGETVDVLINQGADAAGVFIDSFVGQQVIAGGIGTLETSVLGWTVGLHYDSTIETFRPGIPGTVIEGLPRSWNALWVRLFESIGGRVNDEDIQYPADPLDTKRHYTGDVKVTPAPAWNTDGRIKIEQTQPYPLHVLCAFGDLELGESG
jgi:hypothetical protein